ncbi:MAG: heme exporter protein CcmB [Bacteroidales bacterium]
MKSTALTSLIRKELTLEWRQKFAFSGVLLYLVSTVFVCYLAFEGVVAANTWNALFWIILLFAAINATLKGFLQEGAGRQLYYYTLASPRSVILSKIIYNSLLMLVLSLVGLVVFMIFMGNPVVSAGLFLLNLLPGVVALSAILSMVSAIASRARNNFTLTAVLSFPLVLPLMLVLMRNTSATLAGTTLQAQLPGLLVMVLLLAITLVLSVILFPYIWKE